MFKRLSFLIPFCLIIHLLLFIPTAKAQVCPGPDPRCDEINPDAPLDSGVILLLIAGIVFGIKKIRDHQRALKILQAAE